jgi:hypothetical protein
MSHIETVEAVVYSADGVSVRFGEQITDADKEIVLEAFESGERDPERLRDLIESETQ